MEEQCVYVCTRLSFGSLGAGVTEFSCTFSFLVTWLCESSSPASSLHGSRVRVWPCPSHGHPHPLPPSLSCPLTQTPWFFRSINYDEKDPFLCNACGFCKYARFDFMLYAKPCCAVDPIENEEDRKKVRLDLSWTQGSGFALSLGQQGAGGGRGAFPYSPSLLSSALSAGPGFRVAAKHGIRYIETQGSHVTSGKRWLVMIQNVSAGKQLEIWKSRRKSDERLAFVPQRPSSCSCWSSLSGHVFRG